MDGLNTIHIVIGTVATLSTIIAIVLTGFFKTNKEAIQDQKILKADILAQFDKEKKELVENIVKDREETNKKIDDIERRIEHEIETSNKSIKIELEKISEKIDNVKNRYVTHENFKTYADAMSQLLKMSTDRMARIETTLDDIKDDVISIIKNQTNQIHKHELQ